MEGDPGREAADLLLMLGEEGQDWEPREAGAGLASHRARLSLCSLL